MLSLNGLGYVTLWILEEKWDPSHFPTAACHFKIKTSWGFAFCLGITETERLCHLRIRGNPPSVASGHGVMLMWIPEVKCARFAWGGDVSHFAATWAKASSLPHPPVWFSEHKSTSKYTPICLVCNVYSILPVGNFCSANYSFLKRHIFEKVFDVRALGPRLGIKRAILLGRPRA